MPSVSDSLFLAIILIAAITPVIFILYKSPVEAELTHIKFLAKKKRRTTLVLVIGALFSGVILVLHFNLISLLIVLFLIRLYILEFQLERFERGRTLTYDYNSGLIELNDNGKVCFYQLKEVTASRIYQFNIPNMRVVDLYFGDQTLRLTSGLVDFNKVPFLNLENTETTTLNWSLIIPDALSAD